jgi:hypothetical protein
MKRATQMMVRALLGALVLAWMATAGWSQQPSLIWLGTLGGDWSWAYGVSADGSVVVGYAANAAGQIVPFAGRRQVGCKTSVRWAAVRSRGLWCFRRRLRGGWRGCTTPQGEYRAFRWTAAGGMEDLNTTYASLLTNGSGACGSECHLP